MCQQRWWQLFLWSICQLHPVIWIFRVYFQSTPSMSTYFPFKVRKFISFHYQISFNLLHTHFRGRKIFHFHNASANICSFPYLFINVACRHTKLIHIRENDEKFKISSKILLLKFTEILKSILPQFAYVKGTGKCVVSFFTILKLLQKKNREKNESFWEKNILRERNFSERVFKNFNFMRAK